MPITSMPVADASLRLPYHLQATIDESFPETYAVADSHGRPWARAVPTQQLAHLLTLLPKLLVGLYEAHRELHCGPHWARWDIPSSGPDLQELADDEGELEDEYPGAPEFARKLLFIHDVLDDAGMFGREWPIGEEGPQQLELL